MKEVESAGALLFNVSLFGEDCDLPFVFKVYVIFVHLQRFLLRPWSDIHACDGAMRAVIMFHWRQTFTGNFLSESGAYPIFYLNSAYSERVALTILLGALTGLTIIGVYCLHTLISVYTRNQRLRTALVKRHAVELIDSNPKLRLTKSQEATVQSWRAESSVLRPMKAEP